MAKVISKLLNGYLKNYGFNSIQGGLFGRHYLTSDEQNVIIDHLRKGNPVILLVHGTVKLVDGRSSFKSYGNHFITLLGINEKNQIMVGDPGDINDNGYSTMESLNNTSRADSYFLVSK